MKLNIFLPSGRCFCPKYFPVFDIICLKQDFLLLVKCLKILIEIARNKRVAKNHLSSAIVWLLILEPPGPVKLPTISFIPEYCKTLNISPWFIEFLCQKYKSFWNFSRPIIPQIFISRLQFSFMNENMVISSSLYNSLW